MTTWESIRDIRAAAAEAVFRHLGVKIDLVHDGATAANLAALVERGEQTEGARWTEQGAELERIFHLPRQAGFSGAVRPGDWLLYPAGGSERFCVCEVLSDAHEAVFKLRARRWAGPLDFVAA